MSFRGAVEATPAVAGAYRAGLQALPANDRARIVCNRPRRLTGSIHVDDALAASHPNAPRWDYGIGYRRGADERAVWVEVHPASSTSIGGMLKKLEWLKTWLQGHAPRLHAITKDDYYWLATDGPIAITANSPQAKQLALAGLRGPRRRLPLE
jgi:hypothetical protein